ncbi:DUF4349 domain-containing protein [Chloroflexota bacterium]
MKKLIIGLSVLSLLLGSAACAALDRESTTLGTVHSGESLEAAPAPMISQSKSDYDTGNMQEADDGRMIVRNGEISLVVEDVTAARDEIAGVAVQLGGYVVSSRIYGEEEEMRGNISVRVPDEDFDSALSGFRDLAIRVESEITNSQDVTEQYVDLQSQLSNAEAANQRYEALLEKADEVEDIMKIYDYMRQIGAEIEQLEGRIQYLEQTSAMSLITVRMEPEASAKGLVRAGWSVLEVFKSAIRGIVIFGQWLGVVAIWVLIFSPIWGTMVGLVYWRRRKRKSRETSGS